MKVVVDSNVIYAGLYSRTGGSFRILQEIRHKRIQPAISVALLEEYADVLCREPLSMDFAESDREQFLDYLCSVGALTEVFFLWRPVLKDPKDDMVLEVAVASGSQCIITHNVKDFREAHRFGIEVITPKEYLIRKEHVV